MARLPLFWAAYRHMSTDGPPVATSGTLYPGVAIGRPANGRYQPMMRLAAAHSFVHGKASLRPPSKGTAIGTVPEAASSRHTAAWYSLLARPLWPSLAGCRKSDLSLPVRPSR